MTKEDRVQSGSDEKGEGNSPLSYAEALIQAHPDITVIRNEAGSIDVTQTYTFPDRWRWRHIEVYLSHEESSQHHYPTVLIRAYEGPSFEDRFSNDVKNIRKYGLTTFVKVHIEVDEQVKSEVGYYDRRQYPSDFEKYYIRSRTCLHSANRT